MTEKEKYDKIYLQKIIPGYGNSNCGKNFLQNLGGVESLIDIGCGNNQFVKAVRNLNPKSKVVGVDFSCPSADVVCDAKNLPFRDKEFEWVTSFDALEHLLEDEVDQVLLEMKRVSRKFAFSICYRDSVYKVDGLTLHPTVKPEEWWIKKIKNIGAIVKKTGRYIYGEWTNRKLTIGIVVYDDWDGFYFSIQAIRMYHKEVLNDVEFVIINTNPSSLQGQEVAKFCKAGWVKEPLRHFCDDNEMGTATRSKIFDYAQTPYVLVIDSHVMIESGGIKKLIDYFDNVDDGDLIQAPLLYDHLQDGPSCFKPEWRAGMYGTWSMDERSKGNEPFEIIGNGLGLFACRKDSWLGFHPKHVGFGGEELYINKKFKQHGGKTVCLPYLKWSHRFARPLGASYKNTWEDRVKNYFREFIELNQPISEIIDHFKTIGLSEETLKKWLQDVTNSDV